MKFIYKHKWLILATMLLTILAFYINGQRPTFAVGGEMFLPLFPLLMMGLRQTVNEFIEEVF